MRQENNIVECYEYITDGIFRWPKLLLAYGGIAPIIAERKRSHPKTFREFGESRLLNRHVLEWDHELGSYGMGGPGFFGLRLSANEEYSEEWFVLILWGAINWLTLDNYKLSNYQDSTKKEWVSKQLVGGKIANVNITKCASSITISQNELEFKLEIQDDRSKPLGSHRNQKWLEHESQLDSWIITRGTLYC